MNPFEQDDSRYATWELAAGKAACLCFGDYMYWEICKKEGLEPLVTMEDHNRHLAQLTREIFDEMHAEEPPLSHEAIMDMTVREYGEYTRRYQSRRNDHFKRSIELMGEHIIAKGRGQT